MIKRVSQNMASLLTWCCCCSSSSSPRPLVLPEVLRRDALHPVDLDLDVPPPRHRVGHLVYGLLVHLHAVDGQPGSGVQLLVADVALEVLGLLVLDQDLLVVKLPVAVPGERGKKLLCSSGMSYCTSGLLSIILT